jgi:hypothetical protein
VKEFFPTKEVAAPLWHCIQTLRNKFLHTEDSHNKGMLALFRSFSQRGKKTENVSRTKLEPLKLAVLAFICAFSYMRGRAGNESRERERTAADSLLLMLPLDGPEKTQP